MLLTEKNEGGRLCLLRAALTTNFITWVLWCLAWVGGGIGLLNAHGLNAFIFRHEIFNWEFISKNIVYKVRDYAKSSTKSV